VKGPKNGILFWLTRGSAASEVGVPNVAEQCEHVILDQRLGVGAALVRLVLVVERAQFRSARRECPGGVDGVEVQARPRFIWMPSCAAGPLKAADWPSTMRRSVWASAAARSLRWRRPFG